MDEDALQAEMAGVLYMAATKLGQRFWPGLSLREFLLRRAVLWSAMATAVYERVQAEGWQVEIRNGKGNRETA